MSFLCVALHGCTALLDQGYGWGLNGMCTIAIMMCSCNCMHCLLRLSLAAAILNEGLCCQDSAS
jgi:hypothetical protein